MNGVRQAKQAEDKDKEKNSPKSSEEPFAIPPAASFVCFNPETFEEIPREENDKEKKEKKNVNSDVSEEGGSEGASDGDKFVSLMLDNLRVLREEKARKAMILEILGAQYEEKKALYCAGIFPGTQKHCRTARQPEQGEEGAGDQDYQVEWPEAAKDQIMGVFSNPDQSTFLKSMRDTDTNWQLFITQIADVAASRAAAVHNIAPADKLTKLSNAALRTYDFFVHWWGEVTRNSWLRSGH